MWGATLETILLLHLFILLPLQGVGAVTLAACPPPQIFSPGSVQPFSQGYTCCLLRLTPCGSVQFSDMTVTVEAVPEPPQRVYMRRFKNRLT
ncbi:hypothetical protein M5K25_005337 [Dendrobium thyrsiflorum]|uniref:Uncharacterized protein n=1 Tax=Dendrobium thyrsiflorum TaxID=117978 RepID=A0ABD0VH82_DENTH